MNNQISLEELTNDIQALYKSDSSKAEILIERYLEERLKNLLPEERIPFLEKLSAQFKGADVQESCPPEFNPEMLTKLYLLLLGKGVSKADFTAGETLQKLARSLNTIFDRLNELVNVIQATFLGRVPELETIRHLIGTELEKASPSDSLENYLGQIKKAFLTAHEAFKQAAQIKVHDILIELDPDLIENSVETGLKFGPLRKAECFEAYQEKFQKFKNWFESGRFMEELLREFEKKCQKLYLEKKGGL